MGQLAGLTSIAVAVSTLVAAACGGRISGTTGDSGVDGSVGNHGVGGSVGIGGLGGSVGAGGVGGSVGGNGAGGSVAVDASNYGGSAGSFDASCFGISGPAEPVVTYGSIALLFMQDRSNSMASGFPTGSPNSWPNSVAALSAFVTDPASQGLDVGLGFFPQIGGTASNCLGCDQLAVPIGPITQTGPMIDSVMSASTTTPTLIDTPLQCGLQGMIDGCLAYMQQHGEQCVAVFVTDGNTSDPTPAGATCDTNAANLLNIVSAGYAKGVKTFALSLVSDALSFVNQVAQAGGTNSAFDVQAGTSVFVAALDAIRSSVAVQTTLPCQWLIPTPADGQAFDPMMLNVQFVATDGATPEPIGRVTSAADCAAAGGGWYYGDNANPTKVLACPQTCTVLTSAPAGVVEFVFGCYTDRRSGW